MKKIILGILAVVFLLGSFPIRSFCGMASDIMRLLGFVFLIIFIALRIHRSKK